MPSPSAATIPPPTADPRSSLAALCTELQGILGPIARATLDLVLGEFSAGRPLETVRAQVRALEASSPMLPVAAHVPVAAPVENPRRLPRKKQRKPRKAHPPEPILDANVVRIVALHDLSNSALGRALDVSPTTASRWKNDKHRPENLKAFAKWCGIEEAILRTRPVSDDEILAAMKK